MLKVLKFSAPWCAPCQQLAKTLHPFEMAGLQVEEVDIDSEPERSNHYGVMSIPTMIIIKDDKEVDRHNGSISEDNLELLLKQHGFQF